MSCSRSLAAVAAAFFVSQIASALPAQSAALSAVALRQLFPGTFSVSYQGSGATITAHPSGALVGRSFIGSDTGRWRIRGSQLCITLDSWFEGQTRCSRVEKVGEWYQAHSVRFRKI